jgi:hypothetical protein
VCQLSALRLQLARRRNRRAHGFGPKVIRDPKLTTKGEPAATQQQAQGACRPPGIFMGST